MQCNIYCDFSSIFRIGVRAFDNPYRDANINAVVKKIGKVSARFVLIVINASPT